MIKAAYLTDTLLREIEDVSDVKWGDKDPPTSYIPPSPALIFYMDGTLLYHSLTSQSEDLIELLSPDEFVKYCKKRVPKIKEQYLVRQNEWVRKNDIQVGDIAQVLRRPTEEEVDDWDNNWVVRMNDNIGQEVRITALGEAGIRLGGGYWYPYFVLQKST